MIPIQFLQNFGFIYVPAKIEGNDYGLWIDLGMKEALSLNKGVLDKMKKKPLHAIETRDLKGRHYESFSYRLPEIKVGKARIFNLIVKEENQEFLKNCNAFVAKDQELKEEYDRKISGRIGLEFFLQRGIQALFLDVNQLHAYVMKDIHKFHLPGYDINKMVKIPLEKRNVGLVIEVDLGIGKKKLLFDSGCAKNFFHTPLLREFFGEKARESATFTTPYFKIADFDLGKEEFELREITELCHEFDGILGMPFFHKYAVLLDFQNNVVYIEPTKKTK
jgi:hypothetical protein